MVVHGQKYWKDSYISYITNITWKWILKIIRHFERWTGIHQHQLFGNESIPIHFSKCHIIFNIHFHVMLLIYVIYMNIFIFFRWCTTILDQIVRLYPNFNYQHHKKSPRKKEFMIYYCFCTGTEETMFSIKQETDLVCMIKCNVLFMYLHIFVSLLWLSWYIILLIYIYICINI